MERPLGHKDQKQKGIATNRLVLSLLIVALTVMFVALTVAYLFSKDQWTWQQFRFPKMFLISTVIIVLSSFSLERAIKCLQVDELDGYTKWLKYALALGVAFLVTQVIGWLNLQQSGIFFGGTPDGSYLYLISGLHALHLVAGLGVLCVLYWKTGSSNKNPVKGLLLASDASNLSKVKLLATYWHFVDVLWIYLLLFFLFNHL